MALSIPAFGTNPVPSRAQWFCGFILYQTALRAGLPRFPAFAGSNSLEAIQHAPQVMPLPSHAAQGCKIPGFLSVSPRQMLLQRAINAVGPQFMCSQTIWIRHFTHLHSEAAACTAVQTLASCC